MKKILAILLITVITGCVNTEAEKALKDPIILNLVKESFYPGNSYKVVGARVPGDINQCNFCSGISRSLYCGNGYNYVDNPLSCDALDLRLKNLGYKFSSKTLVDYYITKINDELEQIIERENVANLKKQKLREQQRQQQIIDMANGK